MLLADTSIWIDHFRKTKPNLSEALAANEVSMHELVLAELALGSVPNRTALLADLALLPECVAVPSRELIEFVTGQSLFSTGIGYVDAQLLFAAKANDFRLWTRDKCLAAQAERLGLGYTPD